MVISKILIIGPAWIGDMVMAQALLKLLKLRNPHVEIDLLAPGWALPLAKRMPEVRHAIHFPFGHGKLQLFKRYAFAKNLRFKYDQAIVLPGSFKSALSALWAKIPLRTGWLGEWRIGILNDRRILNKKKLPLMIQRYLSLGLSPHESLPKMLDPYYPKLSIDIDQREALITRFKLDTQRKIIALCPGAEFGPAKRWPVAYFAVAVKEISNRGWQVIILGSPKEAGVCEAINHSANNSAINLAGRTSLLEAVDLLSLASGVICNDSGLMHIAAALELPLVVLYGSSTPKYTPPLSKYAQIIYLGLTCSPCFKRVCPLAHFDCMNKITPEMVLQKLDSLINHE